MTAKSKAVFSSQRQKRRPHQNTGERIQVRTHATLSPFYIRHLQQEGRKIICAAQLAHPCKDIRINLNIKKIRDGIYSRRTLKMEQLSPQCHWENVFCREP